MPQHQCSHVPEGLNRFIHAKNSLHLARAVESGINAINFLLPTYCGIENQDRKKPTTSFIKRQLESRFDATIMPDSTSTLHS